MPVTAHSKCPYVIFVDWLYRAIVLFNSLRALRELECKQASKSSQSHIVKYSQPAVMRLRL